MRSDPRHLHGEVAPLSDQLQRSPVSPRSTYRLSSTWTARFKPHQQPWRRHGRAHTVAARSLVLSGSSYGRSLLQVSALSVRSQALSLGGAARLRLRSSVPPSGLEARGAGPAGGRPTLQRPQTRSVLPTHGLPLSLLPGVHERESADLLPVPEPDQPELRRRDSGAGRRAEVSDSWAAGEEEEEEEEERCVRPAGTSSLLKGRARGGGWATSLFFTATFTVVKYVEIQLKALITMKLISAVWTSVLHVSPCMLLHDLRSLTADTDPVHAFL